MELYWPQVRPFADPHGNRAVRLCQSTIGLASALQVVSRARNSVRQEGRGVVYSSRGRDYWREMLSVLRKDVLRRLQPNTEPFLYEPLSGGSELRLRSGVPAVLRRFHGLLTDMIQVRWTAWVERTNPAVLGSDALRQHLFGVDRKCLGMVVEPLLELQKGRCFYTRVEMHKAQIEVDHFLPWSRTYNNSVGNLVLATKAANRAKSDKVPCGRDVDRWRSRNRQHATRLEFIALQCGLPWTPVALERLCEWVTREAA